MSYVRTHRVNFKTEQSQFQNWTEPISKLNRANFKTEQSQFQNWTEPIPKLNRANFKTEQSQFQRQHPGQRCLLGNRELAFKTILIFQRHFPTAKMPFVRQMEKQFERGKKGQLISKKFAKSKVFKKNMNSLQCFQKNIKSFQKSRYLTKH